MVDDQGQLDIAKEDWEQELEALSYRRNARPTLETLTQDQKDQIVQARGGYDGQGKKVAWHIFVDWFRKKHGWGYRVQLQEFYYALKAQHEES